MAHPDDRSTKHGQIGIILLAAGTSRRMGTPKQLLRIKGDSLVRTAAKQAVDSGCRPVVVVLGASADIIAPELNGLPIEIVFNRNWNSGMSSSIHCGLKALLVSDSQLRGVILFLGDQPNVTGMSLGRLTQAHVQSGSGLVAASYSGRIGTPALFSQIYFDELFQIAGQAGAKSLLERYASRVLPIDFPEGACDLDTPEDFADFARSEQFRHS